MKEKRLEGGGRTKERGSVWASVEAALIAKRVQMKPRRVCILAEMVRGEALSS